MRFRMPWWVPGLLLIAALAVLAGMGAWLWPKKRPAEPLATGGGDSGMGSQATELAKGTGLGREANGRNERDDASVSNAHPPSEALGPDEPIRTPAKPPALRGSVTDSEGVGITGASLSWTPLLSAWIDESIGPFDPLWEDVDKGSSLGRTDGRGRFELPPIPAGGSDVGSVIWATGPGFLAEAVLIDPASRPERLTIELEPAPGLKVVVRDGSGNPVEGATVGYAARFDEARLELGSVSLQEKAQLVLRRMPMTGQDGTVALPTYPDQFTVRARKDGLISDVLLQAPKGLLVLTLGGTFSARGDVKFEPELSTDTPMEVACRALEGYTWRRLARVPVGTEGCWSIEGLPVLDVDSYSFRLSGEGVAVDEILIDVPGAAETVVVNLEARPGADIAVHTVDDLGQDLPGAQVILWWQEQGSWRSIEERTDSQAICQVSRCPPGEILIQGLAEGHTSAYSGPVTLPDADLHAIEIVLPKAGSIRGTVHHQSRPVSDFELVWWVDLKSQTQQSISDSQDGSFEITDVPQGDVWLIASSEELGQSEAMALTIERDTPAQVDIGLPGGLVGHGRIVSSLDRSPIPGATVHLYTSHMARALFVRGTPTIVDDDGEYEIGGLSPGVNFLFAQAPGFAGSALEGIGVIGERLDLGVVAMSPAQQLAVRLLCEDDRDLSQYKVRLQGPGAREPQAFSEAGEAVFEGIGPGLWMIDILGPAGLSCRVRRQLTLGRAWLVELPLEGTGDIFVEALPEPGGELPRKASLRAEYDLLQGGSIELFTDLPPDGKHVFSRYPARGASFTVFGPDSTVLGSVTIPLTDAPQHTARIQLGGSPLTILVNDDLGKPLGGTTVTVTSLDRESLWAVGQTTGADGRAEIGLVAFEEVLVHLMHSTRGSRVGARVRPDELPEGLAVLELDGQANLQILLRDGESACPGVRALLYDETAYFVVGEYVADGSGLMKISSLSEGIHRLVLDDPRYWRSEHLVEASELESPQPVEIRRLGSLSIEVLDPGGVPVFGLPVELISMEFGTPVAQWLSNGLVFSGESGLTTDLSGRIRLDGLPHGVYSWRIAAGSAGGLGGEVNVPGGEAGELIVRLP